MCLGITVILARTVLCTFLQRAPLVLSVVRGGMQCAIRREKPALCNWRSLTSNGASSFPAAQPR